MLHSKISNAAKTLLIPLISCYNE